MSVKRQDLVKYLEQHGFSLLREGKKHAIYTNGEGPYLLRDTAGLTESRRTNFVSKQDWSQSSDAMPLSTAREGRSSFGMFGVHCDG
jgi:hypothetical protein